MILWPLLVSVAVAPPPAAAPVFVVETTSGDAVSGRITSLTSTGEIRVGDHPATRFVGIHRPDRRRPGRPREPMILLAGGDCFPASILDGDRRSLSVRTGFATENWTIPLSSLAAVWLVPPSPSLPPDPARYPWREDARRQDAVLLRSGDVVLGTLESLGDAGSVRLVTRRGQPPRLIPLEQVAAVAFDPTLSRPRKPKELAARLVTRDGSRLTLTKLAGDDQNLSGETSFGQPVRISLTDLIALDLVNGPVISLSSLKPKSATTEPYLSVAWPWTADRSVKGRLLRLNGPHGVDCYDHGLGTHPRTKLVYDLRGKYRRFEAIVGLDAETGQRGEAVVRILADGRTLLDHELTAARPNRFSLEVADIKELTLLIDFGPAGDVQADVNWANARLVE